MSTNDVLSKLKAEIKRLKDEYTDIAIDSHYGTVNANYVVGDLEQLLSLIDSLQQEQSCDTCTNDKGCVTCKDGELWEGKEQPCEDLKGAIREWVNLMVGASFPEQDGDYISEEDYRSVIRQTALHFYELGKQSKEPVNEDLEESAWECVLDSIDVNNPVLLPKYKELLLYLFKAGAHWQKMQMIRDCSVQASYEAEIEKAEERGYNLCKEQMLKDAVERTVKIDSGGYPYIDITAELYDYEHDVPLAKEGELVIIVIVKED